MEKEKIKEKVVNEKYLRIVPRIADYLNSRNIPIIFKYKYPLFAAKMSSLPPPIKGVHSREIIDIQRIAKNIVVIISYDGSLKIIDPRSRNGYLNFKIGDKLHARAMAYFY